MPSSKIIKPSIQEIQLTISETNKDFRKIFKKNELSPAASRQLRVQEFCGISENHKNLGIIQTRSRAEAAAGEFRDQGDNVKICITN
jgi:hypothetical protein